MISSTENHEFISKIVGLFNVHGTIFRFFSLVFHCHTGDDVRSCFTLFAYLSFNPKHIPVALLLNKRRTT